MALTVPNPTELVLWLDAADDSTITTSGSDVTTWNDKSGKNNHFGPITGVTTGQRVSRGVSFNGQAMICTGTESDFDFTTNFEIIACCTFSSSNTALYNGIWGKQPLLLGGDSWDVGLQSGRPRTTLRGSSQINSFALNVLTYDVPVVLGMSALTTSVRNYINGMLTNSTGGTWTAVNNNSQVTIGSRQPNNSGAIFTMHEFFITNDDLTNSERATYTDYLVEKWVRKRPSFIGVPINTYG